MHAQFYLGCSGFYYNHWNGKFYPKTLPKTQWLNYYTHFFNTVELNNTFYRYPTEKHLQGWYQKTPENFKFTLKANRVITHLHKFNHTEQYIQNFYKLAHVLEEKLLCVLFQLPPSVHKDMTLLEAAAAQMDDSVLNVLEFRHESWWDSEVFDFLKRHGMFFCSVSASQLPDTLVNSGDALYVRFHGKDGWYMQNYPKDELAVWAKKILAQTPKTVMCYFNNDYNANAPKNCLTLKSLLTPEKASATVKTSQTAALAK